jgi:hypothetical protein
MRRMHAQAGGTWHPIRIRFNWTFVDHPELDTRPGSLPSQITSPRACYPGPGAPAQIIIGLLTNETCFQNGTHKFVDNCRMPCDADSTVNSADVARLKSVADQVATTFTNSLQVEQLAGSPDTINIVADLYRYCGGLVFGPYDVNAVDIVIFATVRPLKQMGPTVAFASSCARHGVTDRPILAHMNVGPETIKTNPDMFKVLLHEITHALGFTPSMYNFYRHPSDNTKTYRQYDPVKFPYGPIAGTGAYIDTDTDEVTVDYKQLTNNPGTKLRFVTPRVNATAVAYWNCTGMEGAELENGGNSSSSTASHWEMRVLTGEYMVAVQSDDMRFSPFTLSLFDDMGFYKANFDTTSLQPLSWGKGMGCAFVNGKCDKWPTNYFCNGPKVSCGYDTKFIGSCQYSDNYKTSIPAPYRYFDSPIIGGTDTLADYCPYYLPTGDGYCSNRSASVLLGTTPGDGGRCFGSSVRRHNVLEIPIAADCFRLVCNASTIGWSQPSGLVRIGNSFYSCRNGGIVALLYPPKSTQKNGDANPIATSFINFDFFGTFMCGDQITNMCRTPSDTGALTTSDVTFSTIKAIEPATGDIAGGTQVNITGTGLLLCQSLRVGGQFAKSVRAVSNTLLTATLAKISGIAGGSGVDGVGKVDVELWCNVTRVCPEGCAVGRLQGQFELVREVPEVFDLQNAVEDFLGTTVGKVVGGVVALVVVVIIVCVIKSCLTDSDHGSSVAVKPAHQYYHEMQPVGPQRRTNFDEEDLL